MEAGMKKTVASLAVIAFIFFQTYINPPVYAQVEEIQAETVAKQIAVNAGGKYIRGEQEPPVKGREVALPIIDEETGKPLGYIVADRDRLVSALNKAGLTEVAGALAAVQAGTAAKETVTAGFFSGTTGAVVLGLAALAGLGLALGGGGGGGGGGGSQTPTSNH